MKVFERDSKHNFVDENNVFVGYDSYQDCCEHAGWFFSLELPAEGQTHGNDDDHDVDGYNFDTKFFHEIKVGYDGGGAVVFKIVKADCPDIYLTLFNSHNGYYAHGFETKLDEDILHKGLL